MDRIIEVPCCESPLCAKKGLGLHYHDGTEIFAIERLDTHFKYPDGFINAVEVVEIHGD